VTITVAQLLAASGLPALEARALLAHRLGIPRERLIAHPGMEIAAPAADAFHAAVHRRRAGEPLAYLLGEKEFYGRPFAVTPDVLVPRPETELLVDLALARLRARPASRVLDLGTGSGCIAITLALEQPAARVVATDASPAALAVARSNAERLGAPVEWLAGDWYGALDVARTFDLIVANPPYVAAGDPHLVDLRFEPAAALTDGGNGLACLTAIVRGAASHLSHDGVLIVEHGHDQSAVVCALFAEAGFHAVAHVDGQGHLRAAVGHRPVER
jgi:release factor glutamine methyltransferase